jgi:transposase
MQTVPKQFLNSEEVAELEKQHHQEKSKRVADRMKAVILFHRKMSYAAIGRVLLVNEMTISKHVSAYYNDKKLTFVTGGSKSKLTEEQTKELSEHLDTCTYTKVADICAYVQKIYSIQYTVQGITSWLYKHNFSYKKPKESPKKADSDAQEQFIKKYEELKNTTPEDEPILFCDAVHPTMATRVTYGWIKKGKNKTIATTASRTRVNVVGAVNLKTMDVVAEDYETINSVSMTAFFEKLRVKYPGSKPINLVLDRGAYNTSTETQEAAAKFNIKLHHLPPYSPNLNPIERLWKIMHEIVQNNIVFQSAKDFKEKIMRFFSKIWPNMSEEAKSRRINDNFQRIGVPSPLTLAPSFSS